jgi:Putative zinc-finger
MTERQSDLACQEIVELVTEYLEGAMAPERVELFEQHVVFCEGCDTYVDQMRRSIALSGCVGQDDVDSAAVAQLMAAFRGWRG